MQSIYQVSSEGGLLTSPPLSPSPSRRGGSFERGATAPLKRPRVRRVLERRSLSKVTIPPSLSKGRGQGDRFKRSQMQTEPIIRELDADSKVA